MSKKISFAQIVASLVLSAPLFSFAAGDAVLKEYIYKDGSYFYSALPSEQQVVESGQLGPDWRATGSSFTVWSDARSAPAGSFPTCRFRGDNITVPGYAHFYTADPSECAALKAGAVPYWIYEGVGFYVQLPGSRGCPTGSVAIYRQYSAALHNHHFQTADASPALGWSREGIPFCVNSVASIVDTFSLESYFPQTAGNQWTYSFENGAIGTLTIGATVNLPSGNSSTPWALRKSSETGTTTTYNTFDRNGWVKQQEHSSSVSISGYGNTSLTAEYSPPATIVPGTLVIGKIYSSQGAVRLTYTNIGTYNLSHATTARVSGEEVVSNQAGTERWNALRFVLSSTISGSVNGQFVSATSSSTYWLVNKLGVVKLNKPNAFGTPEDWTLISAHLQ